MTKFFNPSPQNVFLLVWVFPLLAPYLLASNELLAPVSPATRNLVIFNILMFYFWVGLMMLIGFRGSKEKVSRAISSIDFFRLASKVDLLFKLWVAVYLVNIIGSGGLPLVWVMLGDERTYADFGLPTLGGLGNLIRAFVLSACYLIFFHSDLPSPQRRKYGWMGVFLVFSAFGLETGRGNGVVLVLHPIALHLLITRMRWIAYFKWALATVVFLGVLGGIQAIRYADGLDKLQSYAESSGFADSTGLGLLFVPAVTYIAVPIINTDLNVAVSPDVKFNPYYSLQGLVPSLVRDSLFERGDYGELVNEANNVSSFYIPFTRDFGFYGAACIVTFITLLVAFCHARAMSGDLYYILIYPPLFMSTALSFFSLFFTSLVVLLYPALAIWTLKGGLRRRPSQSNEHRPTC